MCKLQRTLGKNLEYEYSNNLRNPRKIKSINGLKR